MKKFLLNLLLCVVAFIIALSLNEGLLEAFDIYVFDTCYLSELIAMDAFIAGGIVIADGIFEGIKFLIISIGKVFVKLEKKEQKEEAVESFLLEVPNE